MARIPLFSELGAVRIAEIINMLRAELDDFVRA
jgi:hypothetical protein